MSYSSNWFTLLLLCTSAPLVLCCDQFDRGSRQVKRETVDLITEDYDVPYHFAREFLSDQFITRINAWGQPKAEWYETHWCELQVI